MGPLNNKTNKNETKIQSEAKQNERLKQWTFAGGHAEEEKEFFFSNSSILGIKNSSQIKIAAWTLCCLRFVAAKDSALIATP